MTLATHAYLEIEGASGTATFELNIGLEYQSDLTKSYLMGSRGQYIREIVNQTPATGSFDEGRRTGFWLDGGAGDWQPQLSFETGIESVQWGDGSGGDGPGNVTKTDASGADVKAISRLQILQYWIAKSKSDSSGGTRIHYGEWTDGSIANVDSTGISAGAFGDPIPVAITDTSFSTPDANQGDTVSMEGTISMSHVDLWGGEDAPDWVNDAVGAAVKASNVLPDA